MNIKNNEIENAIANNENSEAPVKRGRGRPKGSKNRKKSEIFKEHREKMLQGPSHAEEINSLSEAFDDIFHSDDESKKTFSDRLNKLKKAEKKEAMDSLLKRVSMRCSEDEFYAIARSPMGMRVIAHIKDKEELSIYCDALGFKSSDLDELFLNSENNGPENFTNLPLITTFGLWSQNKIEQKNTGMDISSRDLSLASKMQKTLKESISFQSGVKMASRLWGNTAPKRRREKAS